MQGDNVGGRGQMVSPAGGQKGNVDKRDEAWEDGLSGLHVNRNATEA